MNGRIQEAEESPRVANGVIYWYEGDTFTLGLELELLDGDGRAVDIQAEDTVELVTLDKRKEKVSTYSFTNVENNYIELAIDSDESRKYTKGLYSYDIYLDGERRITVANDNIIQVE